MSGVWSTATLDLSIPSNKTPVPGSGVLYIGGPQLPVELRAVGYTAAIVWFTDAAADIKYFFQARKTDPSGEFWSIGYCLSTGVLLYLDSNTFGFVRKKLDRILEAGSMLIQADGAYLDLSTPAIYGGPILKAKPGNGFDEWIATTRTRTIGSVANCTVNVDWRITIDYIVDVRMYITCPSAPGIGAGSVDVQMPSSMPAPDYSPSVGPRGPYGLVLGSGGSGQGNYVVRQNTGSSMALFTNGNPLNNTVFEGSMTFTVAK